MNSSWLGLLTLQLLLVTLSCTKISKPSPPRPQPESKIVQVSPTEYGIEKPPHVAPTEAHTDIDFKETLGILGVAYAHFLDDDRVLLFGSGSEMTSTRFSSYSIKRREAKELWLRDGEGPAGMEFFGPFAKGALFVIAERSYPEKPMFWRTHDLEPSPSGQLFENVERFSLLAKEVPWHAFVRKDGSLVYEWKTYGSLGRFQEGFPPEWKKRTHEASLAAEKRGEIAPDFYYRVVFPEGAAKGPVPLEYELSLEQEWQPFYRQVQEPRVEDGVVFAPAQYLGFHHGDNDPIHLEERGKILAPFMHYLHPQTFKRCTLQKRVGNIVTSQSTTTEYCARHTGLFVLDAQTLRLEKTLNHGIGFPRYTLVSGPYVAHASGREGQYPYDISVWQIATGALKHRLALPRDFSADVVAMAFDRDRTQLYAVGGYPRPRLFGWQL